MKVRTRTAVYGLAGLALAGLVVFSGSMAGVLNLSSSGVLSILLTDPPSVPDGVSAVYITYSDVAVHAVGLGDSGWVNLPGQGTVNTLGLVNLSQTISSGAIPSLEYNLVRFNISGASVEFNGKNYTANIDSGRMTIPITGGLTVGASSSAAALVDITPTVVNLGNDTDPNFAIAAGARALPVPAGEVQDQFRDLGHRTSLTNHTWYQNFQASHNDTLVVSGLTLGNDSFVFTASNQGGGPITLRLVVLAPASSGEKPTSALGSIPNSVVFAVNPDGTLQLLNGPPGQVLPGVTSSGFQLGSKDTQRFTFSGAITTLLSREGVASGATYYVVVFGSQASSIQSVVAA